MFNSYKRNLNVFHCYKKSESPKDSLFYSHPLPSLPPLPPLPPLPLLPVPLTAPIPPTAPTTPIPARAARTPSLPVRLAPHLCPCGSRPLRVSLSLSKFFIKKYFSHFQLTTKNFQKKLRKNLQDKKNAVPLHPQMRR